MQERVVMRGVGLLLVGMFVGPLAGSSVIVPVVALVRTAMANGQPMHAATATAAPGPHAAH